MVSSNFAPDIRAQDEDEAKKVPPILPCAECKTLVRTAYFNLDGRPLCPRCSQSYREKIV